MNDSIRLNDTDEELLDEIDAHGRATAALLAEIHDKNTQYVRERLARLVEHGLLVKVSRGLYDRPSVADEYLPDDEG